MDIRSYLQKKLIISNPNSKFPLPNYFKKIGWGIMILSLLFITVTVKYNYLSNTVAGIIGQYGNLLGILIVTLSSEKTEDEFIEKLRLKSYMYSFLIVILFLMFIPFISYIRVITSFELEPFLQHLKSNDAYDLFKSYHIILILVVIQGVVFDILKKLSND